MIVPPLVGLPSSTAAAALEPALRFGTVTALQHSDKPLGSVLEQTPAPGTVVAAGTAVDVLVHGGLLVPRLAGTWVEKAKRTIAGSGLVVGRVTESAEDSDAPLGSVLRQTPAPDVQVAAGTAIDLVVLGGIRLPDLRGATLEFSQTALRTLGLAIAIAPGDARRDGIEKPTVSGQDPAPGTPLQIGGTVTVQVVYPPAEPEAR